MLYFKSRIQLFLRNKLLLRLIPDQVLTMKNGGCANFICMCAGIHRSEYQKNAWQKSKKK